MYNVFLHFARQALNMDGPSLMPPVGVEPNFNNPPNKNEMAAWVDFVSLALVAVFVTLRFCSRLVQERKIDDVDGKNLNK